MSSEDERERESRPPRATGDGPDARPDSLYVVWCPRTQRYLSVHPQGTYAWTRHIARAAKWVRRGPAQYACDTVRADYPDAFVYDIISAPGFDSHDTPSL